MSFATLISMNANINHEGMMMGTVTMKLERNAVYAGSGGYSNKVVTKTFNIKDNGLLQERTNRICRLWKRDERGNDTIISFETIHTPKEGLAYVTRKPMRYNIIEEN